MDEQINQTKPNQASMANFTAEELVTPQYINILSCNFYVYVFLVVICLVFVYFFPNKQQIIA
jgi:hypothetical protein